MIRSIILTKQRFEWKTKTKYTYDFKGTDRIKGITSKKINTVITIFLMICADGLKLSNYDCILGKNGIIPSSVT